MSENKMPVPGYSEQREIECQTELEEDCFIDEHPINEEIVQTQDVVMEIPEDVISRSQDIQIAIFNDLNPKKDFAITSKKLFRRAKVITPSKFAEDPIDESKWESLSKSYSKKVENNVRKKPIMKKPKQKVLQVLGPKEGVTTALTDIQVTGSFTYPSQSTIPVYYSGDEQPHYITVLNPEDENHQILQCTTLQKLPILNNGSTQDNDLILNAMQESSLIQSFPETTVTHLPQSITTGTVTNFPMSIPQAAVTHLPQSVTTETVIDFPMSIPQTSVTHLPQSVTSGTVTNFPMSIPQTSVTHLPQSGTTETVTNFPMSIPENSATHLPQSVIHTTVTDSPLSIPDTQVTYFPPSVTQETVINFTKSVPQLLASTEPQFIPQATVTQSIPQATVTQSITQETVTQLPQTVNRATVAHFPQPVIETTITSLTQPSTISSDKNLTQFVSKATDIDLGSSITPDFIDRFQIKENTFSQKDTEMLQKVCNQSETPGNIQLGNALLQQTELFSLDQEIEQTKAPMNSQDSTQTVSGKEFPHNATVAGIIQNNVNQDQQNVQQQLQRESEFNEISESLDIVEKIEHTQTHSLDVQKLIETLQNDGRDLQLLANFVNTEQGEIHVDCSPLKFIVIESSSDITIEDIQKTDDAVNTYNTKNTVIEGDNVKSDLNSEENSTKQEEPQKVETLREQSELKEQLLKWKIEDPEQLKPNEYHKFIKEVNKRVQQKENEELRMTGKRRRYKCDLCTLSFTKSCNLSAHKRIHTKDKRFECQICNQRFYVGTKLRAHMLKHSNSRPFECIICHKSFLENSVLKKHLLTHDGEKPFQCEICDKSFFCQSKLDLHHKSHSDAKPYKCEHCDRRFAVIYYYRRHVKRHTKEKEFKCHICKKGFHLKESHKFHMLTHDESLKKQCEVCQKTFIRESQLKSHVCAGVPIKEKKSKFKCDECDKVFTSKLQLTIHLKEHKGEIMHHCKTCGKLFLHDYLLKRHQVVHSDKKPYKCKICGDAFGWITSIRQHILNKHKKSLLDDRGISLNATENNSNGEKQTDKLISAPISTEKQIFCHICRKNVGETAIKSHMEHHFKYSFVCCVCMVMYSKEDFLKIHTDKHVLKDMQGNEISSFFTCQICKKSLKSWQEIYDHSIYHKENNFTCKFCFMNFEKGQDLQNHLEIHKADKSHQCNLCGEKFASCNEHYINWDLLQNDLINHEADMYRCDICKALIQKSDKETHKSVHVRLPFTCKTCFMNFENEQYLQNHLEIHKGDKPHRCNLCGEKFATSQEVTLHRVEHKDEQEKPNKCETCGKRFRHASDLKNHQRLHTGEKPFSCDMCEEAFGRKDYLRKHKLKTHQNGEMFKCEQCLKEFWIHSELKRHIAISHTKNKPYDCTYCNRSFSQRYEFHKHLENVHKGKPFMCLICPKSFSERKQLNKHFKKEHPTQKHVETIRRFIKEDGKGSSEEDMEISSAAT